MRSQLEITVVAYAQETWVLAHYDSIEEWYTFRCRDADGIDASETHPTEVTSWECFREVDEDYTRLDAVDTTCGCPSTTSIALEPTPAPFTPTAPTSCSDGDSFYLDVLGYSWDDLGTLDGCFSDSGYTNFDLPEYFRGGDKVEDEPVVVVTDNFGIPVSSTLQLFNLGRVVVLVQHWNTWITTVFCEREYASL